MPRGIWWNDVIHGKGVTYLQVQNESGSGNAIIGKFKHFEPTAKLMILIRIFGICS